MSRNGPVDPALLDLVAARATAPSVVERAGGWLLRAEPSLPFRRSNAVVAVRDPEVESMHVDQRGDAWVDERVDRVERFYRARGLAPRFQISASSDPPELDAILAKRGYRVDAPVDLLVAATATVAAAVPKADRAGRPSAQLRAQIEIGWVESYRRRAADAEDERTASRLEGYRVLLAGNDPASVAATVDLDTEPAAVGFGVLERDFTGIFSMATRSDRRRRGAGRAVLGALARWAHEHEASTLYLQVEHGNEPARSLYESVGFAHNHGYHYRVLD